MKNKRIVIIATDYAKQNHKEKKERKKISCPSCELKTIKAVVNTNYIEDDIKED
jgi:hypothetical protein